MRYDDWDVILFPKDSHVPVQEFKTACYIGPDEFGRQLPTLTCYISSLPPSTPFRISVHSWATVGKPSALLESKRKANQKAVYVVQVIVDGARVFRDFFDIASKWPQEIAQEKRTLTMTEQATSQRTQCLEFPPFHQQTLVQSSWDARDPSGRVRILLSEQLISKTASPGEMDLGITNDIVCFSFQHAPKDILDQAGISWPIRNPLYLADVRDPITEQAQASSSFSWTSKARNTAHDVRMQSPLSQSSNLTFARPHNLEPHQRSHFHPPSSHFSRPTGDDRKPGSTGIWDDSFASTIDSVDDVSMDTWSSRDAASTSMGEMAMPEYLLPSSHLMRQGSPWLNTSPLYEQNNGSGWAGARPRKEKERQVVVTLRDDQLGQIIDAMSPPKRNREIPTTSTRQGHDHMNRPPAAHVYYPPKMGSVPLPNRSSAAAMARISSFPDLNSTLRNALNKPSPDKPSVQQASRDKQFAMFHPSASSNKENCPPSQSRLPTPYPNANRVPTPNPFSQRLPTFNSDISMKEPSSVFSSLSRFDHIGVPHQQTNSGKHTSAHAPSAYNSVKSRKEGLIFKSPQLPSQRTRHDQSTWSAIDSDTIPASRCMTKDGNTTESTDNTSTPKIPSLVEIIDLDADAIDPLLDPALPTATGTSAVKLSPFKPLHKSAMSSIDSTGRLERQLFSALGEELGSFEHHMENTSGMEPEGAQQALGEPMLVNLATSPFEGTEGVDAMDSMGGVAVVKRKRQGTLGGERAKSPVSKREREDAGDDLVPRLRGGEEVGEGIRE